MKKTTIIPFAAACALMTALAVGHAFAQASSPKMPRTKSPAGAKVYFIDLKDGATVKSPFLVVMGLSGMGIAPAGISSPDTGHHHVLVDVEKLDMNLPIPMDDKHRHFGRGQTETMLDLPPGKHTLQLVLGDQNHIPHDPPVMSEKITINVTR